MKLDYPFTEEEMKAAADGWGCNCGPSALAFALQVKLDQVRPTIPDFDMKRYTSPTMMKAAIGALGGVIVVDIKNPAKTDIATPALMQLVRVQWTGKWTAPGSNPRWAYCYTHWIAAWFDSRSGLPAEEDYEARRMIFDCNGGARTLGSWITEIVPLLAAHPRGDGGWYPTHVWSVQAPLKVVLS